MYVPQHPKFPHKPGHRAGFLRLVPTMTDEETRRFIAAMRERAAYYRRVVASMNTGRCHEGARELRRGMAAMADQCADDLERYLELKADHV